MGMRHTQHGAFLHQLTRFPNWFPVNVYLVEEAHDLTLIDTALAGCETAILAAAQQIGKPITRIVLTHLHMDHVGAFDALGSALPDAERMYSARAQRVLDGETRLAEGEPAIAKRAGYQNLKAAPTRLLAEGDRVGSLQVYSSPGHSPGDIALLDERDGSLIAGDAFQTRGATAVSGTIVWSFPFPAFATWDRATALASANRLCSLEPARLAIGHGEVVAAPRAVMERAIGVAAGRIGEMQRHGT